MQATVQVEAGTILHLSARSRDTLVQRSLEMSTSHSAISQRIDPADYYRNFIKNGVRIDGRSFSDLRCVAVGGSDFNCLSECGSSLVHFGNTKVACSISVLVGTPSQLNPSSGDIGTHCFPVRQGPRRSDNNLKTLVF